MISDYNKILEALIISIVTGFCCLSVFDAFGILIDLIEAKYKAVFIFIKDFICTLTYCLLLVLIFYYTNSGAFKGLFFIGVLLGSVCYHYLFSHLFHKIFNIVLRPIKVIVSGIYKIMRKILIFSSHTIEKIEFRLYNIRSNSQY